MPPFRNIQPPPGGFFYGESPMTYLKKAADIIVQTVRDYPKGFIITSIVLIVLAWFA